MPPQLSELGIIGIALTDVVRVRTSSSSLNSEQVRAIAYWLIENERTRGWAEQLFNPTGFVSEAVKDLKLDPISIIDPFGFIQLEECETCVN